MKVFVTGASGFVGSAVVQELLGAGHSVVGYVRSEAAAKSLTDAGAEVQMGTLEDLDGLTRGASAADGVIHTAFNHDFSKFAENSELDRVAIETLGAALRGTDRPLLVTSGTAAPTPGRPATENDPPMPTNPTYPRASEATAMALAASGVRASVVGLPQVHDTVKQGFVTYFIGVARAKGVSAYVGDGANRWSAAHVLDVARLYRLALEKLELEKGEAGVRYHAVAEEGVALREIAEAISRGLKVPVVSLSPEEAGPHFGFLGAFAGLDMPVSSALTQERLGWHPAGPGMIADLEHMTYL